MKLVDILARELKDWPDQYYQIYQDSGGHLTGTLSNSDLEDCDQEDLPFDPVSIAWDGNNAVVDRAEWQAAVDALRVEEFVSVLREGILSPIGESLGESMLLLQQVGRAYRKQPEWSEDGLPNVGTKCVVYKGSYVIHADADKFIGPVVTVTARFKSARGIEMACVDSGGDGGCHVFRADMCFHLPTAEEIAAREREDAIAEMMALAGMGSRRICTALYDRNYRKQVTK